MKHLFLAISLVLLAACSGGSDSPKDAPAPEKNTVQENDVTDRSMCKGVVPVGTSIMQTVWTSKYVLASGVQVTRVMYFTLDEVEVKDIINYQTISKNLLVKAKAIMSSNRFAVTNSTQDQTSILVNGEEKTFKLELQTGVTQFNFLGPCLRLVKWNVEAVLVPQR